MPTALVHSMNKVNVDSLPALYALSVQTEVDLGLSPRVALRLL